MTTQARTLTDTGIRRAQAVLRDIRDHPERPLKVPNAVLYGDDCSRSLNDAPAVEHHQLTTRRDAAEYLMALTPPLDQRLVDDWHFWSWLGLFHVEDILHTPERRGRMSREVETFVVDPTVKQSLRSDYRNYLWAAWRLHQRFGDDMSFLLDRDMMEIGDIVRRITNSPRVFNSTGVAELIVRLYSDGPRPKRGHVSQPGGLNHLLRVLPQLELTHDVYGMTPDALLRILPRPVQKWDAT